MPGEASKAAAIIGAAEANDIGYPATPKSSLTLHIEAINNVCEMTGIPIAAIDGIFSAGWSPQLAEYLGLHPKYIDTTSVGGCSFEMHVHHALAAIHAGVINVALVSHGEMGFSQRFQPPARAPDVPSAAATPGTPAHSTPPPTAWAARRPVTHMR